jgi:hypothetical protein
MTRGKTISLYLVDGSPTGIVCAYLSNWTGQAIKIPRNLLENSKNRDEVKRIGVYLLFGFNEESPDEKIVYIGESDNIYDRIVQHTKNEEKLFWTDAIAFTSKDDILTKGHVKYLEYELIQYAMRNSKFTVTNKNGASKSSLPEMAVADMDTFLDNIKIVLPTLGYEVFVEPHKANDKKNDTFIMNASGQTARGYLSKNGFVVLQGSKLSSDQRNSLTNSYKILFQQLIEKQFIEDEGNNYVFVKDYEFSSPSAAAALIAGYSINGRTSWKNKLGKTLKQVEEENLSDG